MADLSFLEQQHVSEYLLQALSKASIDRPADPVAYIAQYLLFAADQAEKTAATRDYADRLSAEKTEFARRLQAERSQAVTAIQDFWRVALAHKHAREAAAETALKDYEERKTNGETEGDGFFVQELKAALTPEHVKSAMFSIRKRDDQHLAVQIVKAALFVLELSVGPKMGNKSLAELAKLIHALPADKPFVEALVATSVDGKLRNPLKFRNCGRLLRKVSRAAVAARLGLCYVVLLDFLSSLVERRRSVVAKNREDRKNAVEAVENIEEASELTDDGKPVLADVLEDGAASDVEEEGGDAAAATGDAAAEDA